jgi:hypothetical protein
MNAIDGSQRSGFQLGAAWYFVYLDCIKTSYAQPAFRERK